ncbi:hypothetical protein BDZ94DRAFT_500867 [Collybia nuda]|uniref:Uncharacterized protein n=1 Tax=Collybia nuda TaxID=64659 RepID=A0A9P6CBC7_9AGAR|nr:hypothetical protein BDZ94DRAFT_500867 [Collybia nuda]
MDVEYNFELESDIVDQHCQTETEPEFLSEDNIPPRPSSRLSFNRTMIDNPLFTEEETTALHMSISGPRWLPRKMGMTNIDKTDMDITALASSSDGGFFDTSSPSTLPEVVISDNNNVDSNEGEDDVGSEVDTCETSDDEEDEFPFSSFERLQSASDYPPFAPSPADCNSWTLQPKYSCLPSPLSPLYIPAKPYSFRHTPLRHVYRQHGYSRHSLLHLKWFWANREDEWMARADRLRNSKTYDNLSIFRDAAPPPALRYPGYRAFALSDGSHSSQDNTPRLPPMSIHPRRGDVLTLRDPYCMHIDRFFVGMPLWTMGKMLWMYDVHVASETRHRVATGKYKPEILHDDTEDDFYEEEQSEGESVETAGSVDSSDDSDTTLVESESEDDLSRCVKSNGRDTLEDDVELVKTDQFTGSDNNPSLRIYGSSSLPFKRSRNDNSVSGALLASATPRQNQTTTCSNTDPKSLDKTRPPWITCWYRRWDLLTELVRNDREPPTEPHNPSTTSSNNTKSSKFYLADDESWSDVLDLDDDVADMENATIMSNPLYYNGFNHQAQCAQV